MYKQRKGGPIGLRATCAIARLVMNNWDRRWKQIMDENKITIKLYKRYMEYGRMVMPPLRHGWRWQQGELVFKRTWLKEDENLTSTEITRRAMENSMQEVMNCLTFTTEVGEGDENWLPTLDIAMRVEENNTISYIHYEKPTTTNLVVQKRSAMDENSKLQILANDLVRRLSNVDENQENKRVKEVIDKYSIKLITSGYTIAQARKIVINGIKGWENKKSRMKSENKRLYRTAKESSKGRVIKKTTGKQNWFRKKKQGKPSRNTENKECKDITRTTTVHTDRRKKRSQSSKSPKPAARKGKIGID